MSGQAFQRQIACIYVFGLVLAFLAVVIVALMGSLLALRFALWLSPVPIAIGMLIDAFALGSVHEAIDVATQQKLDAVKRLQAAHKARSFDKESDRELRQHPRESRGLFESVYRFLVLDVARLLSTGQPTAALALMLKRGIWIACVAYAFTLMFSH